MSEFQTALYALFGLGLSLVAAVLIERVGWAIERVIKG
jgi:hypothetical protein